MFFLFIGGTELSKVKGLSAAGANPEIIPFTSPADADLIRFGEPRVTEHFPIDPEGHPTPAIITRAAVVEADIPFCTVRAGSYIPPSAPYVELGADFGHDPCEGKAVPDAVKIFEAAKHFAQSACRGMDSVTLGESVPGGTTTALLVLRALGYEGMVSSAGPSNPTSLKEDIWRRASTRAGLGCGDLAGKPLKAVEEFGDPVQAALLGFMCGAPDDAEIVLAGGTQMLAVAALLKEFGSPRKLLVATTRYVGEDKSSTFGELAEKIGVDTYFAPLDFSRSRFKGLRDYELGYVKEGAGAGGSVHYAERSGVTAARIVEAVDEIYSKATGEGQN